MSDRVLVCTGMIFLSVSLLIHFYEDHQLEHRVVDLELTAHERESVDIEIPSPFVDQLLQHSHRLDALEKQQREVQLKPGPPILWWPGPTPATNYHYEGYATNGIIYCRSDLITNYRPVVNWTNVVQVEGGGK